MRVATPCRPFYTLSQLTLSAATPRKPHDSCSQHILHSIAQSQLTSCTACSQLPPPPADLTTHTLHSVTLSTLCIVPLYADLNTSCVLALHAELMALVVITLCTQLRRVSSLGYEVQYFIVRCTEQVHVKVSNRLKLIDHYTAID